MSEYRSVLLPAFRSLFIFLKWQQDTSARESKKLAQNVFLIIIIIYVLYYMKRHQK